MAFHNAVIGVWFAQVSEIIGSFYRDLKFTTVIELSSIILQKKSVNTGLVKIAVLISSPFKNYLSMVCPAVK